MAYKEIEIGNGYVQANIGEEYKVIIETGEEFIIPIQLMGNAKVGNTGKVINFSDDHYNLYKFIPDKILSMLRTMNR